MSTPAKKEDSEDYYSQQDEQKNNYDTNRIMNLKIGAVEDLNAPKFQLTLNEGISTNQVNE